MPTVLVAHRSESALEREAVMGLIDVLRRCAHQVEHTSGATLTGIERAAEAADHIVVIDPAPWWQATSGWVLSLRERLELCAANEVEQFAVVVSDSKVGREAIDGPLAAMPRFVLPAEQAALLDRLAHPRRVTSLRSTGRLPEPRPFIARPALDRAIEQAIASTPSDAGRLVWIRGGIGTGKSSLLRAWLGRRDPQATVVHVARPSIAATLRPSAVLERIAAKLGLPKIDLRRPPPRPVMLAIDGLEQLLDRTDELVPEPERREFAEQLAGPLPAGIIVVATSRPLAPGLLGASEPTIDLDAPEWAAEQQALTEALLLRGNAEAFTKLRELSGSNPGAARALLELGEVELEHYQVPPRFADALERAFVRLLGLPHALRRRLLNGLALLRVAAAPMPERLLSAALEPEIVTLLERHAAEWLRREPGHLALTHAFAGRYLATELDPRDLGPHFTVLGALARLRQRGPLEGATLAYATQHERVHQQLARGLASDEMLLRNVAALSRAARDGTLERELELASESARPEHQRLIETMFTIVRRHRHELARAPETLPSLLWHNLVARGFAPSTLDAELSWGDSRPLLRLQNPSTYVDRCHRILPGRDEPVRGCGLSNDGRTAVTLHNDGTLYIWNLETNHARELALDGWSQACALTRDGRRVAVGCSERVVLIDTQRGEVIAEHERHKATITGIAISEDGLRVLSADRSGRVMLWNVQSPEHFVLGTHGDRVTQCVISSDGALGVSGGDDKVVRVWSFSETRQLHALRGHNYSVCGLALTRDAKQLVSICIGEARLWDPYEGRQLQCFDDCGGSLVGAALVADEREVLVAESGKRVIRWNRADGKLVTRHLGHPLDMDCIAATDDGEWCVTGGRDRVGRLWRRAELPADEQVGMIMQITALVPGEQPGTVWAGGSHRTRLLAIADQRELIELSSYYSATALACGDGHLYVSSTDRCLTVYSSATGAEQAQLQPSKDWLRTVVIDCTRGRLAFAGADKHVHVSALDGSRLHRAAKHAASISAIAFTPDGRLVAVDGDGEIKLWDLDGERAVVESRSKANNHLYAVVVDPTGSQIAVSGASGIIEIISLADNGRLVHSLTGHSGTVGALALRSDGRVLVSAGNDRTLRVWSFTDGRLLTSMTASFPLSAVTFVGDRLVVGDVTGNVLIFDVDWSAIER